MARSTPSGSWRFRPFAFPALPSKVHQIVSLRLRHLRDESSKRPTLLDPIRNFLTQLDGDIERARARPLFPRQQGRWVHRSFLGTAAARVPATLLGNREGCLDERFDPAQTPQYAFALLAGHQRSGHNG
jgi:hypothetical protein